MEKFYTDRQFALKMAIESIDVLSYKPHTGTAAVVVLSLAGEYYRFLTGVKAPALGGHDPLDKPVVR